MLEAGTPAPDFALHDQNGAVHHLADYRGRKLILYFYPADMSPGCTKQTVWAGRVGLRGGRNDENGIPK